ncbi:MULTISPECIES: deaminated glutathione amidase [Enterobacter]|uniref:deaminated glutathione amidase n=1 Tax=Enterobacter TaxID=547 RepID=UPI0015EA993F|nr:MULTISPECIES: deaminated glutathione amidase [Enterobacter]HDR2753663.1 deaminated glutathione amidase [Enterobacter asburiae]QMR77135.1 deaminated glutathione amidase [Enterobacter sp. RHBSTW-00175]WNT37643.1 deaminated glutathione amidase [Enterobacter cloacae]HDR2789586.1 deaminated glutathione amidase [Enterobacter asburiae]HDR2796035.1 deaminated glutathione amidase [Enterobacter asburiae]
MYVAVGQFAVTPRWEENAQKCVALMAQAQQKGALLLVLPEALLARDDNDPDMSVKSAQPLDGGFLRLLLQESAGNQLTTVLTIHVPSSPGRAVNTLVAIREGAIIASYAKLHLYDAFSIQESRLVDPGDIIPPLINIDGMNIGLMTCYDVRFPEMAMSLALKGADVLVLPAAWVKGPLKEHHWATLLAARALDTTCYIVAAGECGNKNIGQSRVVDPLGVTVAAAAEAPTLLMAEIFSARISLARQQLPVLQNRRFAPPQLF